MQTGISVELILFGMIAVFLVLRLRSVLGRRTGFERQAPETVSNRTGGFEQRPRRTVDGVAEEVQPGPAASATRRVVPDPRSPVGQALARIQGADRGFDPERFLEGAEGAFRMIVAAYAAGDRIALRPLLSDDTYAGFERGIAAHEEAGETQRTEIRAISEMSIDGADLRGTVADIAVRFVSDQINLTTGRDDAIVAGSESVTEIVDVWTFQRDLRNPDPTWKLVGTHSV